MVDDGLNPYFCVIVVVFYSIEQQFFEQFDLKTILSIKNLSKKYYNNKILKLFLITKQ